MGKVPLNLADDASVNDRATDAPSVRSKDNDAGNGGNLNKIAGHTGSVKSKIYQTSKATPTKGHSGPNKKGVGVTSYSNGAVKTALNIVGK